MSVVAPIASLAVRCSETTQRANNDQCAATKQFFGRFLPSIKNGPSAATLAGATRSRWECFQHRPLAFRFARKRQSTWQKFGLSDFYYQRPPPSTSRIISSNRTAPIPNRPFAAPDFPFVRHYFGRLLTPLFVAEPFSAVRAALRWRSRDEFEDSVSDGWQSWLRRRPTDSFFPSCCCEAAILEEGVSNQRHQCMTMQLGRFLSPSCKYRISDGC